MLEREHSKPVKMTRFLCQELLYEFATGALDPKREQDVAAFLPTCRESQREFERLKRAVKYTERAAQASVGKPLYEALLNFEPAWKKRLREVTLWSSQRGWRALPYLFVSVTVAVGLGIWKPWQKTNFKQVTLADQSRVKVESVAHVEQPVVPPPAPAPVPVETTPTPSTPVVSAPPVEELAETKSKSVFKGQLLCGDVSITDFASNWPAIREKVIALGGKAAGNSFGWFTQTNPAVIDFSLPESNYKELELFLGAFGPVRFNTEKVPRVMPEGQIRIILTVKDADKNEGAAKAP